MHSELYRSSLARAMGLPNGRLDAPGVDVVTGDDRRGRRRVSHYRVGARSVIWIDPELAGEFDELRGGGRALEFHEFRDWSVLRGAERLGAGYEHVLVAEFGGPTRSDAVRVLDGAGAAVAALWQSLADACDPADVDAADFDTPALDEHLAGWVAGDQLLALAGARPFEARPGFHDIGVLVHPDRRRGGLGRQVVAGVVVATLAAGHVPLYRCETDHEGSWRLCRGLGFVPVVELEAFRWAA